MRRTTRIAIVATATAVTAALFGPTTSASAATVGPPADLTIVYQADQKAAPGTWTLHCPSRTGTHPDPEAACDLLETATTDLFAPTPSGVGCLMIWGGPQTAQVVGWWRTWRVSASFSRTNSCEMSRWIGLVPVLPKV